MPKDTRHMFERLSNKDITDALDELIVCLGVREEQPFHNVVTLLQEKDTEKCVREIATLLGLPIRINLSYVPKGFRPGTSDGFRSRAVILTDENGQGSAGITAQVSIPQNLPMYGTPGLQGYIIQVRVSEKCHEHPDTFIAVMAHELSHVLLATLLSLHKDSELYTDLVPIVLGLHEAVRQGRKTVESTTSGNTITTHTTTYGYLTDAQFELACNYVKKQLQLHARNKKRLLKLVEQVQRKKRKAARSLAAFRDYFRYLDSRPPERMKKEHGERMVQLHGEDCSLEWESRIATVGKSAEIAEAVVRPINHYTTAAIELLKHHTRVLDLSSDELNQVTEAIIKDERMLRKYVGFIYRLRRTLWHRAQ